MTDWSALPMSELIAVIGDDNGYSVVERVGALSSLGLVIQNDPGSLLSTQAAMAMMDVIRTTQHAQLATRVIYLLDQLQLVSSVGLLIDVALADGLPIFDDGQMSTQEDIRLRSAAIAALGKIRDDRALIPLMSLLNDSELNYRIRISAAESLGRMGNEHALQSLMDILEDDQEQSVYLRESSAKALGMLGDLRAMEALISVFQSKKGIRSKFDFLKERVVQSLGKLVQGTGRHDEVVQSLLEALQDEAPSIRLAAIEALAELGDVQWLPVIKERVFDTDDMVAQGAIGAMYELGGDDVLTELLSMDTLPKFLREDVLEYLSIDEEDESEETDEDDE